MIFFLDTANLEEIKKSVDLGLIDGVTTNPSIIASSGRKFKDVIKEICSITKGDVSAEVLTTEYSSMLKEALDLADIAENVVIKVPLIPDGIKLTKELTSRSIKTNVTLCFSSSQALLAAKVGATYISPFIGRIDDISYDGVQLIQEIKTIYDNFGFKTKILSASIRHPLHVKQVALMGSDACTLPYSVLMNLLKHPLTDIGLEKFIQDSKKITI
jgi:transaldolase